MMRSRSFCVAPVRSRQSLSNRPPTRGPSSTAPGGSSAGSHVTFSSGECHTAAMTALRLMTTAHLFFF